MEIKEKILKSALKLFVKEGLAPHKLDHQGCGDIFRHFISLFSTK